MSEHDIDLHRRVVNSAVRTLNELVLGQVTDPWAASHLRGTIALLTTLESRLAVDRDEPEHNEIDTLISRLRVLTGDPAKTNAPDQTTRLLELERLIAGVYTLLPSSPEAIEARRLLADYRRAQLDRTTPTWRSAADLPLM